MTAREMAACGWLVGLKVLTAAEVKKLPVGTKLSLIGPDRYGNKSFEEGIVLQWGKIKKFRVDELSGFSHINIRDYPGKVWAIREGTDGETH